MLSILQYFDVGSTQRGQLPIPLEPAIGQAIEVGLKSVQSEPFQPTTCIVKLLSGEDCQIDIGPNPDATNSTRKLMAGKEQTISVPAGMNFRVAVVASNSGSGSVTGMDSLESLLKLLASPADFKAQLATLAKETAKHIAAAKASKDAVEATGWAGKLALWEADLNKREQSVVASQADVEKKLIAIKEFAAG